MTPWWMLAAVWAGPAVCTAAGWVLCQLWHHHRWDRQLNLAYDQGWDDGWIEASQPITSAAVWEGPPAEPERAVPGRLAKQAASNWAVRQGHDAPYPEPAYITEESVTEWSSRMRAEIAGWKNEPWAAGVS